MNYLSTITYKQWFKQTSYHRSSVMHFNPHPSPNLRDLKEYEKRRNIKDIPEASAWCSWKSTHKSFNIFHLGCQWALPEQGSTGGDRPGKSPGGTDFPFLGERSGRRGNVLQVLLEVTVFRVVVFAPDLQAWDLTATKKHLENCIFLLNITHSQDKIFSVRWSLSRDVPQDVICTYIFWVKELPNT